MNLEFVKNRIKINEGFSSTVYTCPTGHLTVGYGHLLTEEDDFVEGVEYDRDILEDLFEKDFAIAKKGADKIIKANELVLTDIAYEVLIEMVYQLGEPRTSKFKKMIAALQEHRFKDAADEMILSRWYQQTPERCKKLAELMRLSKDDWKKKK